MKAKSIQGYKNPFKRLNDSVHALDKTIKLRRIEPYADVIEGVLNEFVEGADKKTMMFKQIRQPALGTTNRLSHQKNVRDIAGSIADNFDWLNSNITRIIGRVHDIGHTPMGHSGEWWISRINAIDGMPNHVHNAIGARRLVYKENIYDKVEDAIKKKYPEISKRKLNKIKSDLWLIMDGINCHNGEQSESTYSPDFSKEKKHFDAELMECYVTKGFDRQLIPATSEGCLMRLCDKISYIPLDLVDIFRNGCNIDTLKKPDGTVHNFYNEYGEIFDAIGMPRGSIQRLLDIRNTEDSSERNRQYDKFAHEMQQIFIDDVKRNTRRNKIRMSPEMAKQMYKIRDLNNAMMVDYVIMEEDHRAYIPAIKILRNYFGDLLLGSGIVDKNNIKASPIINFSGNSALRNRINNFKYDENPELCEFVKFVGGMNKKDFDFTVESCRRAYEKMIDGELSSVVDEYLNGTVPKSANHNEHQIPTNYRERQIARMNFYREKLNEMINSAEKTQLFQNGSTSHLHSFKKKIWLNKAKEKIKDDVLSGKSEEKHGFTSLSTRVARDIGALFIATLTDEQFFELIQKIGIIDEKQATSLSRSYNTFQFRKEAKPHEEWTQIAALQKSSTQEQTNANNSSRNPFERLQR